MEKRWILIDLASRSVDDSHGCHQPTPCKPMNAGKFCLFVIPLDVNGHGMICDFNSDLVDNFGCWACPSFELFDPVSGTLTAFPEPFLGGEVCLTIKEYCVVGSRLFIWIPLRDIYSIDCSNPLGGRMRFPDEEGHGLKILPMLACNLCVSESASLEFDGETPSVGKQPFDVKEKLKIPRGSVVLSGGNVMDDSICPRARRKFAIWRCARVSPLCPLSRKYPASWEKETGSLGAGIVFQVSETGYS